MILRKINAVLSLITTLLLADHALFFSAWMISGGSIPVSSRAMPWVLAGLMVTHAAISIFCLLLGSEDEEERKVKHYFKLNKSTLFQRITGALVVLLLAVHVTSAAGNFQPKLLHAVVQPLFFAAALAHVSVSVSKALITLGIGTAKVIKIVDLVMKVFCIAVAVFGIAGLYCYLFVGAV